MIEKKIGRRVFAISISVIMIACMWLPSSLFERADFAHAAEGVLPSMTAPSSILVDMETGQILFEQNIHDQLNPAATTMMMTALLIIENMDINEVVKSDGEPVLYDVVDPIDLEKNEEMTVSDLLYAMMLTGSNEAANTLAIALDGSIEAFADRMNAKASLLGMTESSFKNPSGIDQSGHHATAFDLALLARTAMKNEVFREIVGTVDHSISKTNKSSKRDIRNNNGLLYAADKEIVIQGNSRPMKYEGTTGIIQGQSSDAGNCIVASAKRDGLELIGVVLKAKERLVFDDAVEMFEYGFDNYALVHAYDETEVMATIRVTEGTIKKIDAVPESLISVTMPQGSTSEDLTIEIVPIKTVSAPVTKGDALGTVTVSYAGEQIGMTNLVATESIPIAKLAQMFSASGEVMAVILKIIIGIVILLVLWGIITIIRGEKRKRGRNSKKFYGMDYSSKEIRRIKRLK